MRLVNIEDSEVTVAMHWQHAELLGRVLADAAYNLDSRNALEAMTVETIGAAFLAAATAAFTHGRVVRQEEHSLEAMREAAEKRASPGWNPRAA
jgi:hypothetical protein